MRFSSWPPLARPRWRGGCASSIPELLTNPFAENRLVLTLASHLGNWEWILSGAALAFPGRAAGVYKPLNNPFFEAFMRRLRTRMGADAVPMLSTLRYLAQHRGEGRTLSLLLDQSASSVDRPYWTTFMHQEAGFYTSAERLATQFDCAVVYVGIRRVRRGYYEITFTALPDGRTLAQAGEEFPITEAFVRQLERDMRATAGAISVDAPAVETQTGGVMGRKAVILLQEASLMWQ